MARVERQPGEALGRGDQVHADQTGIAAQCRQPEAGAPGVVLAPGGAVGAQRARPARLSSADGGLGGEFADFGGPWAVSFRSQYARRHTKFLTVSRRLDRRRRRAAPGRRGCRSTPLAPRRLAGKNLAVDHVVSPAPPSSCRAVRTEFSWSSCTWISTRFSCPGNTEIGKCFPAQPSPPKGPD
jgi:hypothetical protein